METKAPPPLSAYATSCLGARACVCVFLSFPSSWDELILFFISLVCNYTTVNVCTNQRTYKQTYARIATLLLKGYRIFYVKVSTIQASISAR